MKLTTPQKEIIKSDARFKVVAAGRRFGKSYASIAALAKFARFPNSKVMYVSPTYRMSKQILWEDLKRFLKEKRWVKKINESELQVTLVNNSIIMLRSADNPDSIRGIGLDFLVLDECADIPKLQDTWQAVLRPTLSDRQGHALIIGSPKGRNYFYEMWCNANTQEDWAQWQYTTLDGGNVTAEEIEAARRDLDERTFQQEYLAQWVNYQGLIYYNLHKENIKEMPVDNGSQVPLHIGMDFNVSPIVAAIAYQHAKGLHIFDEIEIYGSNTAEMVQEINRRYPGRRIFVYPDASGAQRRTSANGVTDHLILQNAGYKLKVGSVNPAVQDRISSVNSALLSATGDIKLTIDPSCTKLLKCVQGQTYKEGTRIPDKETGLDHFSDAVGYLVNNIYPIKRDYAGRSQAPVRRSTGSTS